MESFTEFYMNDLRYHASFHGVKMKPYISRDEIIKKTNELDVIIASEPNRDMEKTLQSMRDKIESLRKNNDHIR